MYSGSWQCIFNDSIFILYCKFFGKPNLRRTCWIEVLTHSTVSAPFLPSRSVKLFMAEKKHPFWENMNHVLKTTLCFSNADNFCKASNECLFLKRSPHSEPWITIFSFVVIV